MQSLFATVTNVNFDPERLEELIRMAEAMTAKLGGSKSLNPFTFRRRQGRCVAALDAFYSV